MPSQPHLLGLQGRGGICADTIEPTPTAGDLVTLLDLEAQS